MESLTLAQREAIAERLHEQALAIHERALGPILAWLYDAPVRALAPVRPERDRAYVVRDGVAILPICGPIFKRVEEWEERIFGDVGCENLLAKFRLAVQDPEVRGIVLHIDSPGGTVAGVQELADEIFKTRGRKPMLAIADDAMFSAAYWIGSAADKVVITSSGGAGSIGVLATHIDRSKMYEDAGLKVTVIKAGERKDQLSPFKPLSEDGRAKLEQLVQDTWTVFVNAVARHRGLEPAAIRAQEADTFEGARAVKAGLADQVQTAEAALAAFRRSLSNTSRSGVAAAAEEGTVEAENKDNVVQLDQARAAGKAEGKAEGAEEARKAERQRAETIRDQCVAAGCPAKAADFIATGASVEDVARVLAKAKADADAAAETSGVQGVGAERPTGKLGVKTHEVYETRRTALTSAAAANPLVARLSRGLAG